MIGNCAADAVEIAPEQRGRVRVGITTRIAEEPKLIMLSYPRIIAEGVDHWRPARSGFLQAVNENHRRPRTIELLQLPQHRSVCVLLRVEDPREAESLRPLSRDQHCGWRAKIDGQRESSFANCNPLRLHRLHKQPDRSPFF